MKEREKQLSRALTIKQAEVDLWKSRAKDLEKWAIKGGY